MPRRPLPAGGSWRFRGDKLPWPLRRRFTRFETIGIVVIVLVTMTFFYVLAGQGPPSYSSHVVVYGPVFGNPATHSEDVSIQVTNKGPGDGSATCSFGVFYKGSEVGKKTSPTQQIPAGKTLHAHVLVPIRVDGFYPPKGRVKLTCS